MIACPRAQCNGVDAVTAILLTIGMVEPLFIFITSTGYVFGSVRLPDVVRQILRK